MTRREIIKASAIAGAAAWSAPVIIDSLASPAAAFSNSSYNLNGGISWAMCVFDETVSGTTTRYAVQLDGTNCDNSTLGSNDTGGAFGGTCHSESFSYNTDVSQRISD